MIPYDLLLLVVGLLVVWGLYRVARGLEQLCYEVRSLTNALWQTRSREDDAC